MQVRQHSSVLVSLPFLVGVVLAILSGGCSSNKTESTSPDAGEAPDSTAVGNSGTATVTFDVVGIADAALQGKSIYLQLIGSSDDCTATTAAPLHQGYCVVGAQTCQISLSAVALGTYNVCAFLDANSNVAVTKGGPDTGDRVGNTVLQVSEDDDQIWSIDTWITI